MNESVSLDDLALFLLVAESGALSQAAKASGTPLPTASRRMTRLEQDLGRKLFLRGRAGYGLTQDGRSLAAEVAGLATLQRRLARWAEAQPGPQRVRITGGFWSSRLLAQGLVPTAQWVPEFVQSNAALDLARREADIGIRNHAPDHPWLARQKVRQIQHVVYGVRDAPERFITLPPGSDLPRSQAWLHETFPGQIGSYANDIRLCFDLALSGFGRVVLPSFVGDATPGLQRFGAPIPELSHDEWLISHHEARHDPPIRAALEAIRQILASQQPA